MTMLKSISVLLLVAVSASVCFRTNFDAAPTWSNVYSVKGVLSIPYAELEEPFYAWYSGPTKQSRIDYYGNMVQTYQLGNVAPYGTSLKIAPVTTETEQNVKSCLQVNGTSDTVIETQSILPSLTGFTFIGQETVDGLDTEKWQLVETVGEKENKYTIWLRYKVDVNNPDVNVAVPVKYVMKGYNTLLGSHYDHYFIEYEAFDNSPIDPDIFEINHNMTCSSFPGPGAAHIYTFNPMREFVRPTSSDHVDFEFDKFKQKHNKEYENEKEHALRKEIFRQNLRLIHSVNRQNRGYSLAVNHLADKNELELKALRGKQYTKGYNGGAPFPYKNIKSDEFPDQLDWRLFGAVSQVKDQSVCGSCWSFGTVGAIEGAYFLKNGGKLVRLSQQALIDCSWGYGNNGCDGGEDFRSYQWMLKHGGIPTEESYGPYLGQDGYCHADSVPKVATITGYVNVTRNDESALRLALFKHGPVSVSIDASLRTFSFYSNGVYYDPKCGNTEDRLDHSVLAVGYGTMNDQNYWLVKNSWSNYWGNDGYVLMSSKDNNCGVMTTPTYVTM